MGRKDKQQHAGNRPSGPTLEREITQVATRALTDSGQPGGAAPGGALTPERRIAVPAQPGASPPPAEAIQSLTAVLRQLDRTMESVNADAGAGRLASQLQALLGADPSALRAGYEAQRRIAGELTRLVEQVEQQRSDLRGLSERATPQQVRASIEESVQGLQPAFDRLGDTLAAARRQIDSVDQRVSPERVDKAVAGAAERLTRSYAETLTQKLGELQKAFDFLDDHRNQLRDLIDQFGPGGAPVLQQENQALREAHARQAEDLKAALEAQRGAQQQLTDREHQLFQLRAAQGSLESLEELERRRKDLAAREQELSSREALQAENQRQKMDLVGLRAELEKYQERIYAEQLAQSERAELARLRKEEDESKVAHSKLEQLRLRQQQDLNRAREDNRRLEERLRLLQQAEELATQRQERLTQSESEAYELRQRCEGLLQKLARINQEASRQQQEVQELQALLRDERKERWEQESEWRRGQEAEVVKRVETAYAEARLWADEHASALSQRTREELSLARQEQEKLRKQLQECAQTQANLTAESRQKSGQLSDLQHQLAQLGKQVDREREALRADEQRQEAQRKLRWEDEQTRQKEARDYAQQRADEARAEERRATGEHQRLQRELVDLSARRGTLEAQLKDLEQRRADLRERVLPREERVRQLHQPIFVAERLAPVPAGGGPSEREWLEEIERGMTAAGYRFPRGILRAFHTSLKVAGASPLTILSGISGTGKSELPRLYADIGGLTFLPIPVQPSWDSPSDLFGFYNYSDGRLKAEPLARLLAQISRKDDPLQQGLTIVLLDEMNLARVEYYFAELLSRLEVRRSVGGGAGGRERASVHLDVGAGEAELLFLDERVLFVGTMNEDESTQSLSAKVMDRACMLSFPRPRGMHVATQTPVAPRQQRLAVDTWRSWLQPCDAGDISEGLNAINEIMDELRHPFGHRLFRAIHSYIANYPGAEEKASRDAGWADQWAMKILPRLKGLECDDHEIRKGLDKLKELVPERLQDDFARARRADYFDWAGSALLYADEASG